jgi:hypothetical protein
MTVTPTATSTPSSTPTDTPPAKPTPADGDHRYLPLVLAAWSTNAPSSRVVAVGAMPYLPLLLHGRLN